MAPDIDKIRRKFGNRTGIYVLVCIALIIIHGMQWKFRIDLITVGLLVLCMLPVLQQYLTSVKVAGVELQIRERERLKQIFAFLEKIASKKRWTFYEPRHDEVNTGRGFTVLIEELMKDRTELEQKLKDWLKKDNELQWFAAEVIGHYKIKELEKEVYDISRQLDLSKPCDEKLLNCLWAYSSFDDHSTLTGKLQQNIHEDNRIWIISALMQMEQEYSDSHVKEKLRTALAACTPEEKERARARRSKETGK